MPGFVIHLAVGKIYEKNNDIKDINKFERGIIAPDLTNNKSETHYGLSSKSPGLNKFLQTNKTLDEFKEGYFLHLVTDYLFYNRFLNEWSPLIYNDYDILNDKMVHKYGLTITEEVQKVVKPKKGKLTYLDEDELYEFINFVGKMKIRQMVFENSTNFEENLIKIKF